MTCGDMAACHDEDVPCDCEGEDTVAMSYNPTTGQWDYII